MWISVEHRQHNIPSSRAAERDWTPLDTLGVNSPFHCGASATVMDVLSCSHSADLLFLPAKQKILSATARFYVHVPCDRQTCLWRLIGEITKTWSHWTRWHLDTEIIGVCGSQRRKDGRHWWRDPTFIQTHKRWKIVHLPQLHTCKRWNWLQQSRAATRNTTVKSIV